MIIESRVSSLGGIELPEKDIVQVKNLVKYFPTPQGLVKAIDGIDFSIGSGETFGLVGESGSGKSTTGYVIVGIYAPTSGAIYVDGQEIRTGIRKRKLSMKKRIQMVFQDPGSSLNPRKSIKQIIELPLKAQGYSKQETAKRIAELLEMVELPKEYLERYPRELGGGEKQMVAVARALATNPSFIVLDEPTSALDVSMQARIINMLLRFQKDLGLSYLFITHNLSLMRNVASRVAIMYCGKICEIATSSEFFVNPLHPYTKMLLSSIPVITREEEQMKPKKIKAIGEIPSPVDVPPGCSFNPRCTERMDICNKEDPLMKEVEEGHFVRCHLFRDGAG
jgi:peptide/nickel transport system ATP-binding protein